MPLVDTGDHLKLLLKVLCVYQALQPESFREQPPDFAVLLDGVREVCRPRTKAGEAGATVSVDQAAELQTNLLQLLAGCPDAVPGDQKLRFIILCKRHCDAHILKVQ